MKEISENLYPGSSASAREILDLANAYYGAALHLMTLAQKDVPLSRAPARMCAIHAIELYLNAFLRSEGAPPEAVRGRMHNLSDPQFISVLHLRAKTVRHLDEMTQRREYLIARYAPERVALHTELNRLTATLVEVMTKVGGHLEKVGSGKTASRAGDN